MMDLREKLAFTMWHQEAKRAAPNVANRRTEEAFRDEGDQTRDVWLDLADAIIAALPGMVKQLEWRGEGARSLGGTYTYGAVGGKWSLRLRNFLIDEGTAESFESARDRAKAIANAHHRAAIMAALGVEGE